MVSAPVYWSDGSIASPRSVIYPIDGRMKDGRPIEQKNGRWVIVDE